MINFYNVDKEYQDLATMVYNRALEYFGQTEDIFEIDLEGVSKEDIHEINLAERGVDRPTDVLSFQNIDTIHLPCNASDYPMDIDYETGKIMLGDILVCLDIMQEQAVEYGHTKTREMAYLTLHGVLHLFGFDHILDDDKKVMRTHEDNIMNSLNITR